jgi:hypothetical protein
MIRDWFYRNIFPCIVVGGALIDFLVYRRVAHTFVAATTIIVAYSIGRRDR